MRCAPGAQPRSRNRPIAAAYPNRNNAVPQAMITTAAHPRRPGRSPRKIRAKATPNNIAVSRTAATGAIGATVIAQSATA